MSTQIAGTISKGLSGPGLGEDEFEADLITGGIDLEGDSTPASGATPPSGTIPLLWNHNPEHVVGVARYARVGNKLTLRCTLIPKGTTPEGDLARVCAKSDFGIGMSAGFQPTEVTPIKGTRGKTYTRYRLLEASLVAVPCDPAARITARAHDAERAERRRKAADQHRKSRMDHARALADAGQPANRPAPQTPSLSRKERVARAQAALRAGMTAPERRLFDMPHGVQRQYAEAAEHARRVGLGQFSHDWETGATREIRMAKAAEIIRRSRPGN